MRFSRGLVPTIKEAPADATNVSHILLTRGGYIRRVGAGVYDFLPLGLRVLRKLENIVREEMDRAGALEILMPALLPAEYFQETGRWQSFGDTLLRIKDRKGADFHLGPTHEEIVTDIARRELRSYRELPKNLYQIQTKFRDEPRPRGGLVRTREFVMKDAYSFDVSLEAAQRSYETMRDAYSRIFDRLELNYRLVAADSGAMGGSTSAEFQALVESGEDSIMACDACSYAANVEVAAVGTRDVEVEVGEPGQPLVKAHTPGHTSIEEVTAFLNVDKQRLLKSLLYTANGRVVMVVVRGDHEVNEVRLARALGATEVQLANESAVREATGANVGFAGPVGFTGTILVDRAAARVRGAVTGANETDYHWLGVAFGRDWTGEIVDVRLAASGDACPACSGGKLRAHRGIEAGHIFVLGTHYSEKMRAEFIDEQQQKRPLVMGCYGIGVSRLVATTVEQHHDADGIRWPIAIAPYQVHLVTLGRDESVVNAASALYSELSARGIEVLWDDRDERAGVKFKDADLIGIPLRVTMGTKGLRENVVELKLRRDADAQLVEKLRIEDAAESITTRVRHLLTHT
ncbi:MAG: proline--tRNA ligase [Myxococcota bacterium]